MIVLPEQELDTGPHRIRLRTLTQVQEMVAVVELQRQIWGYGSLDTDPPYPPRSLFALAQSGGQIVGVFHKDQPVGFSMAWIGLRATTMQPYLHSQLLGVLEEYRHMGIGFHLKDYQLKFARHCGLDLVSWTFDPLRPANANLNIRKLGAVVECYSPDHYGEMRGHFGQGRPSDRVWADWYVNSARVRSRLSSPAPLLSVIPPIPQVGLLWKESTALKPPEARHQLLLELPLQMQEREKKDPSGAEQWQRENGRKLADYLSTGYRIVDFLIVGGKVRRGFYLLERRGLADLLAQEERTLLQDIPQD